MIEVLDRKNVMKIIFMLIGLFLVAGFILYFYGLITKKEEEPVNVTVVENTIEKYGYSINENASKYYKSEFDILKEMTSNEETSEEEIIKQIAKLFVIDLYSLNNKINKYEVTSAQYYHSDKRNMFTQKVMDNLYDFVEDDSYDTRNQELPEVSTVEIVDSKKDSYSIDKDKIEAYLYEIKISYVKDLGYDNDIVVTLIKDKDNYSVVKSEVVKNDNKKPAKK